MNEFYIIFKNGNVFNGTTKGNEETFKKLIINPMINDIESYQFYTDNTVIKEVDSLTNKV